MFSIFYIYLTCWLCSNFVVICIIYLRTNSLLFYFLRPFYYLADIEIFFLGAVKFFVYIEK